MNIRRMRRFLAAAALAVVVGAGPTAVWAGQNQAGADESPFLQRFDQDGDGLISAEEFPGDENQFNRLDINGDGYLEPDEVPPPPPRRGPDAQRIITEFDVDGDGQLSSAEFPGPADHFDKLDTDGDGFLNSTELLAGRPGPPPGNGFQRDDADQDGLVSRAEFSGPADLFARLDADGDGYISREEARQGHPRSSGNSQESDR